MRYQGGKTRLKKTIVPLLLQHNPQRIIEPFLGGGSIMVETHKQGYTGQYVAGDYNADLNEMWRATIEDGWLPTDAMKPTREEYHAMKHAVNPEPTALRGLVRTGATFSAIPWGPYVLDKTYATMPNYDLWGMMMRTTRRDLPIIANKNITIQGGDYREYEQHITPDTVIYCDPPYVNTAGYSKDKFDHEQFWETMRAWSQLCPVYISEYTAPEDFVPVHSKDLTVMMGMNHEAGTENKKKKSENIYVHINNLI